MRDISRNKTTQKYKPLINASTLPLNEKNRVVRPIGPNIKGAICGLIISTAWCQFIISATKIYPCNKFLYQHCKILIAVLLTILIRLMTSSAKFESVFVYLLLLCTIAVNRFTAFFLNTEGCVNLCCIKCSKNDFQSFRRLSTTEIHHTGLPLRAPLSGL